MTSATFVQTSFLGGEWSDYAQGRLDHPRYKTALNLCLNLIPIEEGAAPRRPGFFHNAPTRSGAPGRTITFAFDTSTPYTIEFTDGHIRFFQGMQLVTAGDAVPLITSISTDTPAVVTVSNPIVWSTGDQVVFQFNDLLSAATVPLLSNRQFSIVSLTPTTFSIFDALSGKPVNGAELAWISGLNVSVGQIVDLVSPFINGTWQTLRVVQDGLIMILMTDGIISQVLTATPPSTGVFATFTLAPAIFRDGPYLDPFLSSIATPSATKGLINVTLSFTAYDAAAAYTIGAFVTASGVSYQSIADQNVGNTPASSPTKWTTVSPAVVCGPNGLTTDDIGRSIRFLDASGNWTWGQIVSLSAVGAIVNAFVAIANTTVPAVVSDGNGVKNYAACAIGPAYTYIGEHWTGAPQQVSSAVIYPSHDKGFYTPPPPPPPKPKPPTPAKPITNTSTGGGNNGQGGSQGSGGSQGAQGGNGGSLGGNNGLSGTTTGGLY